MKVLCPQQTLPLPCSAGITCGAGAAPLHRVPAPSPSQEGLGSSCHNKTAAGSLRDTQDSSHAGLELIGIPAPRERLLWVRSGTHWAQPELDSVCKLSDTVEALREEGTGFKGLNGARSSLSCCSRGWELLAAAPGCGCPALCAPGTIPWGREHSLAPNPTTTTSRGHPDLVL